jgi:hypothetical protein
MTLRGCLREKEVRELVLRGQWPQASSDELRVHAAGCRQCADLALVMQSFQAARSQSSAKANPGSAGVLWWRAQLRRRKTAMEKIDRPIVGAQIFAFSITLVIALVFAISQLRRGVQWSSPLAWFGQLPRAVSDYFADLWTSASAMPAWGVALGIFGLAAVALFSGVMLYVDRQRR